MLKLDPHRAVVTPKDAATVVVVREGGDAKGPVEIFCVKRHAKSGFMGGALVFPGGKLAPEDSDPTWVEHATELSERARSVANDEHVARGFAIAALRELLEEAALLATVGDRLDDAAARALRDELAERERSGVDGARAFRELIVARGLSLDIARLEAFARWVTPAAEERRYDTRFYVMPVPRGQLGAHDNHETTMSFWASPAELVRLWEAGEIFLAPPTLRTIELCGAARSIADVIAIARAQPLDPLCPFFAMEGETPVLALPGDPLYPTPEAPAPGAPVRFVLENGRFVPVYLPSR